MPIFFSATSNVRQRTYHGLLRTNRAWHRALQILLDGSISLLEAFQRPAKDMQDANLTAIEERVVQKGRKHAKLSAIGKN